MTCARCSTWDWNEPLFASRAIDARLCPAPAAVSRQQSDRRDIRARVRPHDAVCARRARATLALRGTAAIPGAAALLERPRRGTAVDGNRDRRWGPRANALQAAHERLL